MLIEAIAPSVVLGPAKQAMLKDRTHPSPDNVRRSHRYHKDKCKGVGRSRFVRHKCIDYECLLRTASRAQRNYDCQTVGRCIE